MSVHYIHFILRYEGHAKVRKLRMLMGGRTLEEEMLYDAICQDNDLSDRIIKTGKLLMRQNGYSTEPLEGESLDQTCPSCMNEFRAGGFITSLACGHQVCSSCDFLKKCPICHKKVTSRNLFRITALPVRRERKVKRRVRFAVAE